MIDLTAVPAAEGQDAWPADQALLRHLDAARPAGRVTVSPDGRVLPAFTSSVARWSGSRTVQGTFERVDW